MFGFYSKIYNYRYTVGDEGRTPLQWDRKSPVPCLYKFLDFTIIWLSCFRGAVEIAREFSIVFYEEDNVIFLRGVTKKVL